MPDGNNNPNELGSVVIFKFDGIGSVLMDVAMNDVTPLQLLAAAAYLEVKGRSALIAQENERLEREREQGLAVPSQRILIGR